MSRSTLPQRRRQATEGIGLLLAITAFMWLVEAVDSLDAQRLDGWGGIRPRNVSDLWSIFTSWFLHASFVPHLLDNTIPFLFMGAIIALQGARKLGQVTLIVIVLGGLGTWLVSPAHTVTVGASGVVFGYATYLFARGLFDRSPLELLVGAIVGLIWGGALVSSVVPHTGVSWQGHICGAVAGVIAAYLVSERRRRHESRAGSGGPGSGPGSGGPSAGPDGRRDPLAEHHAALDRILSG